MVPNKSQPMTLTIVDPNYWGIYFSSDLNELKPSLSFFHQWDIGDQGFINPSKYLSTSDIEVYLFLIPSLDCKKILVQLVKISVIWISFQNKGFKIISHENKLFLWNLNMSKGVHEKWFFKLVFVCFNNPGVSMNHSQLCNDHAEWLDCLRLQQLHC